MNKKNSKSSEFKNFSDLALEWWNPNGKFKILHEILPLRMDYILKNTNKKNVINLDILDLGCGGGLTSEPLARLGAKVTGIDFIEKNITVAKNHAKLSKLKINYIHSNITKILIKKKFDVILVLEVLEHLRDWENLIYKLKMNLKPNGRLILSTINQTLLAKFFGIYVAEKVLKWVPDKTHHYKYLIKPEKLKSVLNYNQFKVLNIQGMNYNPVLRQWKLNKNFFPINYFCTAKLN
jgi:2-polyprenyl-6-hydroxyphenyl methylase / 3-demethylubiquinone-9 3-methyltransferase